MREAFIDRAEALARLERPNAAASGPYGVAGSWLRQLYTLSEMTCAMIAREVLKPRQLDIRDWLVLRTLAEQKSLTQQRIAAVTSLDKVAVNRAASWLKQRGLVASSPNAADGRSHLLELTPDGEATAAACADEIGALEREMLRGLADDETWELARSLKHLHQSIAHRV